MGKRTFGFERTLMERFMVRDDDDSPLYSWVVAGVTTAHAAAQLTRRAIMSMHATPTLHEDGFLYHFTSATAAQKILESADLWMTDYRDFADRRELRDGLDIARVALQALYPCLHEATVSLIESLLENALPENVYVTCFCMLRDSTYHWREYAADGTGAALVIDPDFLDDILVDPFILQFTRVAYTWDEKARLFAAMVRGTDALIRFDISRGTFAPAVYFREIRQVFGELLTMCKDVSFLKEHEIRIVFSPNQARAGPRVVPVRSFNGRRYVTMRDALPEFRLPVHEVIVGPDYANPTTALPVAPSKIRRADFRPG